MSTRIRTAFWLALGASLVVGGCNEPGTAPSTDSSGPSSALTAPVAVETCGPDSTGCELPANPAVPVSASSPAPAGNPNAAAASANALGRILLPIMTRGTKNVIYSPLSISSALAMTAGGASGQTQAQLMNAFGWQGSDAGFHSNFSALFKEIDVPELKIANRLWADQHFSLLEPFVHLTARDYQAPIESVDFANQPAASRKQINTWVEEKTNQKIQGLLKANDVTSSTRLVVTNAVYFKAFWEKAFKKSETQDADFKTAEGKSVKVPTMHQRSRIRYFEDSRLQAIALPYKGNALSAVFILPVDHRAGAFSGLDLPSVLREVDRSFPSETNIYIPRFKFNFRIELAEALHKAGIVDAFEPGKADFSRMDGKRDLSISKVVHQAFVDLNEEGTEAAAATGITMRITSMPVQPKLFRADRPFGLIIRHNASGAILFVAKVNDPSQLK